MLPFDPKCGMAELSVNITALQQFTAFRPNTFFGGSEIDRNLCQTGP